MKIPRTLTCLFGLVVLSSTGCGSENNTTASDSATTALTTTLVTSGVPTSSTSAALTDTGTSATEGGSGTLGETQGLTTVGSTGTSDPSTSSSSTGAISASSSGSTSDASTSGSSTTGMPEPCMPGDTDGMGNVEKSFLWVANSDQGTISKVDTQALVELARYRSGPLGQGYADNPSRTAVSVDGRFVVVNNRTSGYVTMIAANVEDCVDKNGNGMIETSKTKDDILGWTLDECIRWSTKLPTQGSIGSGPRGVTWSPGNWDVNTCSFKDPKVWVGYLPAGGGVAHMARFNGETGVVEETIMVPNWVQGWSDYGPYGAALDKSKNVWFTGLRGEILRINTNMGNTIDRWTPPNTLQFYGMTVDPDGDPWFGGCSGPVSTFNPMNNQFTPVGGTNACYRGLAADKVGNVWVASNGPCGVVQIDHVTNTLVQFHNLNPCNTPVGVSVDDEGFVWVVDEFIGAWKIDPVNPNNKQLINIASDHYTYSDMTGGQLKSVILPQ